MSVISYQSNEGETLYRGYVNIRSKKNPSIRTQRKFSGVKTQREAERMEVELIRECEREICEKESQGEAWGYLVEQWEKHLATEKAVTLNEHTRSDYVASIQKHTSQWWKRTAASISRQDVREVLNQLQSQGKSQSYQNTIKVIINRVFVFGMESGLVKVEKSPTTGIQLGRQENKKPEILTIAEIKKLLESARQLNHPWYSIWAMALLTGMRNGELFALTWSDVDWENKMISVTKSYHTRRRVTKSTKSGDWRTVPISTELMAHLKDLKAKSGNAVHVLPRLQNWARGGQARELRRFCIGAGLPSVRFHALRACFATQLIRSGVPPIQIQKICGWKDLETMQRYIRLAGIEIDGATEALKILPDQDVMAKVVNLFTKDAVADEIRS